VTLQELTEKRNKAVADARQIIDKADAEKRALSAQEKESYDKAWKEAEESKKSITEITDTEARRKAIADAETELRSSTGRRVDPGQPGTEQRTNKNIEIEIRSGKKMVCLPGTKEYNRASEQHNEIFNNWLRDPFTMSRSAYMGMEKRTADSISNDVIADGGALHAPLQFNAMLIKVLDNLVFARKRARIFPVTTSDTLGTPTMPTLFGAASWTTELQALTADQTAQFGTRDLKPNLLTKAILVSQKLLKTAAISPEGIVADELGRVFSYAEENGFLTGSGSGQPLGVFTASSNGIDTSRDIPCGSGNTGTDPEYLTFDGLQAMKFGVKAQYRMGASWTFNRTVVQDIATIKDNYGRYIWEPSGQAGSPDVLLGFPVDESEFAPNTMTSGSYVGLFGNWYYYWIADLVTGFEMQRLNELYALTNQVGFVGRRYVDGAPVIAEAFSRGKLA
jgi:HK97 family phage major capsid protein